MPSNAFSLNAYSNLFSLFDRQIADYSPYKDGGALIRGYCNSGNFIQEKIGIAANWKLLDGKLQLYVSPEQTFFKSTGMYDRTYNPFTVYAQATYYLNNLYFQAYYETPETDVFFCPTNL